MSTLPIAKEYTLVYDMDLGKLAHDIRYDADHSSTVGKFDRVGYLVDLGQSSGEERHVFVSMDAFTTDVKKIGIPTMVSGARFQQKVKSLDVFSNVPELKTGTGLMTGNMEFWPDNYGMPNAANIDGASSEIYDFGDELAVPADGYGSMQVHNYEAKQTLFAINHWGAGAGADLGIGNSPGNTHDWTFTGTAGSWATKRLRVYVRPVK
jgi:sialate O-acetylesterase